MAYNHDKISSIYVYLDNLLWIIDYNCIDGIDPAWKRVVVNKNVDFLAESVTCLSFEIYNEIFVKKI